MDVFQLEQQLLEENQKSWYIMAYHFTNGRECPLDCPRVRQLHKIYGKLDKLTTLLDTTGFIAVDFFKNSEVFPEKQIPVESTERGEKLVASIKATRPAATGSPSKANVLGTGGAAAPPGAARTILTQEEFGEHAATMFSRSVALAYGDFTVLEELSRLAKEGEFPLGEFNLP